LFPLIDADVKNVSKLLIVECIRIEYVECRW